MMLFSEQMAMGMFPAGTAMCVCVCVGLLMACGNLYVSVYSSLACVGNGR